MAGLLGQPSGWRARRFDGRVGDERLLPQLSEAQRRPISKRVVRGKGDQPRLACQHLDLDLGLTGEKPGEGNVDIAYKDVVDSAQQEVPQRYLDSRVPLGEHAQHAG
jgi:hypothetical protein